MLCELGPSLIEIRGTAAIVRSKSIPAIKGCILEQVA
jgi:hypothetical protein